MVGKENIKTCESCLKLVTCMIFNDISNAFFRHSDVFEEIDEWKRINSIPPPELTKRVSLSIAAMCEYFMIDSMKNFQSEDGEWASKTFPQATNQSITEHLKREVNELSNSKDSCDTSEAADCLLILLHHAHKNGYDLLSEAKSKFEINKKRKWGKPDKLGVVEHVID